MKMVSLPIKMFATFSPIGKILPIGFVCGRNKYSVTLIQKTWSSRSIFYGSIENFLLQVIRDDCEQICEVAFYKNETRWMLVKI